MSGWAVVEGPLADFETSSYVFDFEDYSKLKPHFYLHELTARLYLERTSER